MSDLTFREQAILAALRGVDSNSYSTARGVARQAIQVADAVVVALKKDRGLDVLRDRLREALQRCGICRSAPSEAPCSGCEEGWMALGEPPVYPEWEP